MDELLECKYCGQVHTRPDDRPPAPDDEAGWIERAAQHTIDCPWVTGRMQETSSGR